MLFLGCLWVNSRNLGTAFVHGSALWKEIAEEDLHSKGGRTDGRTRHADGLPSFLPSLLLARTHVNHFRRMHNEGIFPLPSLGSTPSHAQAQHNIPRLRNVPSSVLLLHIRDAGASKMVGQGKISRLRSE